jgi:hypothetical protein
VGVHIEGRREEKRRVVSHAADEHRTRAATMTTTICLALQ